MSDFRDLVQTLKAEALAGKVYPSDDSDWRWFCRQYSATFSTPLSAVLEMNAEEVILAVFESQLDKMDLEENIEEIMDKIYVIEDPTYEAVKEKDLQDFIKDAEDEEELRVKIGAPAPGEKGSKRDRRKDQTSLPGKDPAPKDTLPKQGYINMSYLDKEEES